MGGAASPAVVCLLIYVSVSRGFHFCLLDSIPVPAATSVLQTLNLEDRNEPQKTDM